MQLLFVVVLSLWPRWE